MHRDVLNFCVMTKCVLDMQLTKYAHSRCRTDFLITTSIDGHLKLWKKQETGIEFVKHFRAHASPIVGVSESADGQMFASISEDGSVKVFDVVNFGTRGSPSDQVICVDANWDRHDKYAQAWLRATCVLLGAQAWSGSRAASNVSLWVLLCRRIA